jgi:16S rRNA C967 or C1407 C5-methylase (RsmB/RsmF family)
MGKWKRSNKNRKKATDGRDNKKPADASKYGQERDPYVMIENGNYKLEAFYAYQGLHNNYFDEETGEYKKCETLEQKETERKKWLHSLKSTLPASFRIGNDIDSGHRESLEKELEDFVGKEILIQIEPRGGQRRIQELDLKTETKLIAPAKKITFIPHAYQLSLDRQTIRRNSSLNGFHDWLKVQTDSGFITRSETVSMIPPVILDVKPHHFVLDMCAAPGSKTSQLLEIVNQPAKPHDLEPSGCVVANDADAKRAFMLIHQLKRINSPSAFYTNCEAQFFPLIRDEAHPTEGIFDRVLCDVPCGGDGTARKNPGIWKRWNQLNHCGLHALQLAIALNGARMTKVGGYMCYSTCSMNPVENESVVAAILRASEGSLELVDRRSEMKGLIARPGMSTWKVVSEEKSKKAKDMKKKYNPKMQARRKEFEEKAKQLRSEGDDSEKAADTGNGEEKEDVEDLEEKNRLLLRSEFKPSSYDDANLKAYAESVGLIEYKSFDAVPLNLQKRILKSCFPPTEEEAKLFNLEKCIRILPHDMDTGGFFVALLRKVSPINANARERFQTLAQELKESQKDDDEEPQAKKVKMDPKDNVVETKMDADMTEVKTGDETEGLPSEKSKTDVQAANVLNELEGEKDGSKVGTMKSNFLRGKDGMVHRSLGKDDFVPVADDIFAPLIEYYGLSADSFRKDKYMMRACVSIYGTLNAAPLLGTVLLTSILSQ